jgi:hypothetical protein
MCRRKLRALGYVEIDPAAVVIRLRMLRCYANKAYIRVYKANLSETQHNDHFTIASKSIGAMRSMRSMRGFIFR